MPETVCFTCGMGVGDPHRLNRLDNGQLCPACRDRVLAALPPLIPDLHGVRAPSPVEEAEAPEDSGPGDTPAA